MFQVTRVQVLVKKLLYFLNIYFAIWLILGFKWPGFVTHCCKCSWIWWTLKQGSHAWWSWVFFFFFWSHNPASGLLPWQGGPFVPVVYYVHIRIPPSTNLRLCFAAILFHLSSSYLYSSLSPCHHFWHHSSMRSISCSFPSSPLSTLFHLHFWFICF